MVPDAVLFYMDLPRNANGKIDRKKLVNDFLENSPSRGLDTTQQDAERIQ
jgi:acyl-coenzyme A synthetase/AMP-(fatty) acid ligase